MNRRQIKKKAKQRAKFASQISGEPSLNPTSASELRSYADLDFDRVLKALKPDETVFVGKGLKRKKLSGLNKEGWKNLDVNKEVGKKKYTEGQKNYMRAIKTIESRLGKVAADLKMKYGSDDIEELANEYYIRELDEYSPEELKQIEEDFNKTHGYHIRLENATNPYSGIDFLSM